MTLEWLSIIIAWHWHWLALKLLNISIPNNGNAYSDSVLHGISRGYREGGLTARSKKFKTPFLRDIEKFCQELTAIGLKPHHFFLF